MGGIRLHPHPRLATGCISRTVAMLTSCSPCWRVQAPLQARSFLSLLTTSFRMLLFTSPHRVGLVDVVANPASLALALTKPFPNYERPLLSYCRPHPRAHSPALSSLTSPSVYPPPSAYPPPSGRRSRRKRAGSNTWAARLTLVEHLQRGGKVQRPNHSSLTVLLTALP